MRETAITCLSCILAGVSTFAVAAEPATVLSLSCAQPHPALNRDIALPARLEVDLGSAARALLVVEERRTDIVLVPKGPMSQNPLDLAPSGWAFQPVTILPTSAPAPFSLVSLRPSEHSGRFIVTLACAREGESLPGFAASQALQGASVLLARTEDATTDEAARGSSRRAALALLAAADELAGQDRTAPAWLGAQIAHARAFIASRLGETDQARAYYRQAAARWSAAGDALRASWAIVREAQQARRQGDYAHAAAEFERVSHSPLAQDNVDLLATAVNDACLTARMRMRPRVAERCYADALDRLGPRSAPAELATLLANHADSAFVAGDHALAAKEALHSLAVAADDRISRPTALASLVLGNIARAHGDLQGAIGRYEQAIDAISVTGDVGMQANVAGQLGASWLLLGEADRAQSYLKHSFELYEKARYAPRAATALLNLARLQELRGDLPAARGYAERAAAIIAALHAPLEDGIEVNLVEADIAAAEGRLADASRTLQSIVQVEGKTGYAAQQRLALLRGQLAVAHEDPVHAAVRARTVIAAARRNHDPVFEVQGQRLLARSEESRGSFAKAATAYEAALNLAVDVARTQSYPLHRFRLLRTARDDLDSLLRVSQTSDGPSESQAVDRLAAVDRLEAAGWIDPSENSPDRIDPKLIAAANSDVRQEWELNLDSASSHGGPFLDEPFDALSAAWPRVARQGALPRTDIRAIAHALAPQEAVIVAFSGSRDTYVWSIRAGSVTEHRTHVSTAALATDVAKISADLADPSAELADVKPALEALAERIGLTSALQSTQRPSRIAAVVDSPIGRIPFDLLIEAAQRAAGPSADTEVSLIPTLKSIVDHPNTPPCCSAMHVFAFADPAPPPAAANVVRDAPFGRLPGAREEIGAITDAWPRDRVVVRTSEEFSKPNVLAALATTDAVVHFATHGLLSRKSPELSALLLAEPGQRSDLGVLGWNDIVAAPTKSRLVVINACDSAAGSPVGGYASVSISQAFLMSGAHDVVAAFWAIDDKASAEFARHFYYALAQGSGPARSVAFARAELARDPRFARPYYWAAVADQARSWPATARLQQPSDAAHP